MKILIIGGGPAGMFAGIQAKMLNTHNDVYIFEKNEKLGKKLNITGKGRCNVTNACGKDEFFDNIVTNQKFCYTMFSKFSNIDLISFFENNGVELKIERGNRVFPKSDCSYDITDCLVKLIKKNNINVYLNCDVQKISLVKESNKFVVVTSKCEMEFDKIVIATGGSSYKTTGSDGAFFEIIKKLGHTITKLQPALVPIKLNDLFIRELQGLSLKNVALKTYVDGKPFKNIFGEMLFTNDGISGPIVLTLSSYINKFEASRVNLYIDLKPALNEKQLEERIKREIDDSPKKQVLSLFKALLPSSLAEIFGEICYINEKKSCCSLTKTEIKNIISKLKKFNLTYSGLYDINAGIVTSGGVCCDEICPQTMESKIVKGIYFAGEVVDVDCLTGGFNLQFAFSSAYLAGINVGGDYVI